MTYRKGPPLADDGIRRETCWFEDKFGEFVLGPGDISPQAAESSVDNMRQMYIRDIGKTNDIKFGTSDQQFIRFRHGSAVLLAAPRTPHII